MKQALVYNLIEECCENLTAEHHAVFEHEYKSDEKLMTRIKAEHTIGASCFNPDIDIVEAIKDAIYESETLLSYMKNDEVKDAFRISYEMENCGKKYLRKDHDWSQGALACDHIIVIVQKVYDKYGYCSKLVVLTAYPV